jgi:ribonuclease R
MSQSLPAPLADIVRSLELAVDFPEDMLREVEAFVAQPGIDDPSLADHEGTPFVTIDAATSRDLDQAVHVAREADGYLVAYAIADASHYVRPGSALFREAMRRGATYYLPGLSVPMLPRALSEGLVSLNPDGPRRALVFLHRLDARAEILSTELVRARIRSRAKLSFSERIARSRASPSPRACTSCARSGRSACSSRPSAASCVTDARRSR